MKNKLKFALVVIVLLPVLMLDVACQAGGQEEVSQQTVQVTRGDIAITVTGGGKIETSREVKLAFGSAGKIAEILVQEGDKVKKGDVLARLDTRSLELSLSQAKVAVTQAELAQTQAMIARDTAEFNLKQTRDSEETLKLALLNAQINEDIAVETLSDAVKSYSWDDFKTIESELNKAKTFYQYALDGLNKQPAGIMGDWEALLERAKDRLEQAQADYDNFISGHMNVTISIKRKQVDSAKMAVTQAETNLADLQEELALKEENLKSAVGGVSQAEESVALASESLAEAQRQLDEATITATIDGLVAEVPVKVGEYVSSLSFSPATIVHVIDPTSMELVVDVDEIDIPLVDIGREALVTVDALPDDTFKGVVTSIYPLPKEEGGVVLYEVRLSLDVPNNSRIKVGMSASADMVIDKKKNILIVPNRAVYKDAQGNTMVNVMSGDTVEEKPVVTGLDDGLRTEIVSGLTEGETIVYEVRLKVPSTSMF